MAQDAALRNPHWQTQASAEMTDLIKTDCPACGGTGDQDPVGPVSKPCRYCGGTGKVELDVDREAVKGDDRLKIQEEDVP